MSTRWYPIYQRGNPQLRVFLPNFWMKLMNPETFIGKGNTAPPNKLYFVVSSEMTRFDVKNYLEKIYQVPVANVKTFNKMGKTRQNHFGNYIVKDDDYKVAFVTLPSDHKFEWPDLKIKSELDATDEETKDDVDEAKRLYEKSVRADTNKYRPGVPTFFGL